MNFWLETQSNNYMLNGSDTQVYIYIHISIHKDISSKPPKISLIIGSITGKKSSILAFSQRLNASPPY